MTVPIEASRVEYVGNGVTTAFPTQWYFQVSSQVRVRLTPSGGVETLLTEGVDYTVTTPARGSGTGGTVTFLSAPGAGAAIVIERDVLFVQNAALRIAGPFDAETHEDAFDFQMMALQEVVRDMSDLELASSSATIAAGSGLTSSGVSPVTLHVGAGPGIIVGADTVAVDFATGVVPVRADGGAVGTGTKAAREDHRHDVQVGNPAVLHVGDTTSGGSGSSLALANHQHAVPAGLPVSVTKSTSAEGVASTFARSDHKHDVSTAPAVSLTDTANGEGAAATLARSDHTHAHGDRDGGTLHAAATTTKAGFLSAADKVKLDGLAAETISTGETKTNDATPTVVLEWTPVDKTVEVVRLSVCGVKTGAVDAAGYTVDLTVRRFDGTTSIIGSTPGVVHESAAAWAITVAAASPKVVVTVTGVAATIINWKAQARRLSQVEY